MKLLKVMKKTKPLLCNDGKLMVAKGHIVYVVKNGYKMKRLFSFEESCINKTLNNNFLLYRTRRAGVYSAVKHKKNYFFSYGKKLFRYGLKEGLLTEEMSFENGRGPLQFCSVTDLKGFQDCVCFGEYFENDKKTKEVHIYAKLELGSWKIAYTFTLGEIDHIHALVPDKIRNCIWILTGDFGRSAGIWMATDNFKNVMRVASGQQHRACVAFPIDQGLLYATDTQLERNSIRILFKEAGAWSSKTLHPINGSCIYGCELKDYFVFSTSTEPDINPGNIVISLLDNRPGPGIVKNSSDILLVEKNDYSMTNLCERPKDVFPYRLFQFGTIMFAGGSNNTNKLYAYNVGSKENDLATEFWDLDQIDS